MNIVADLHTHTKYSDGVTTMAENVATAHAKGLKFIAITDHGPSQISSGIDRRLIPEYRREIDRLNAEYAGEIRVLMGMETNIISLEGHIDLPEEHAELYDIVLMGFHKTAKPISARDKKHFWMDALVLNRSGAAKVKQQTTQAYINALQRNHIDIIVHPKHNINIEIGPLAKACAQHGAAMEISARRKHLEMTLQDAEDAKREGVDFVIDSDGHAVSEIGVFAQALDFCRQAGIGAERVCNAEGYEPHDASPLRGIIY